MERGKEGTGEARDITEEARAITGLGAGISAVPREDVAIWGLLGRDAIFRDAVFFWGGRTSGLISKGSSSSSSSSAGSTGRGLSARCLTHLSRHDCHGCLLF